MNIGSDVFNIRRQSGGRSLVLPIYHVTSRTANAADAKILRCIKTAKEKWEKNELGRLHVLQVISCRDLETSLSLNLKETTTPENATFLCL